MNNSETKSKLAIILGVGIGLGSELSKKFALEGHPVAMAARTTDITSKLEDEIAAAGGTAKGYIVDAEDEASVKTMFNEAEDTFGPVGVAIYSIGGRELKSFLELTAKEVEDAWRKHFLTAFNMGHAAASRMVPRGEGTIIFTGATSGLRGMPDHAHFAGAKFGVRGMAESMWREFAPKGIHVAQITLNGGVGNERRIKRDPHLVEADGLMPLEELADIYYQTYCQPRNCWTFNVELRPWTQEF